MNKLLFGFITILSLTLVSCASSQSTTTVSDGINITDYKHIVYGDDDKDGAAELTDILLLVQNELSGKMSVVSANEAIRLIDAGEKVISPRINVKSEKWDGGHTYITISFYDFNTNQLVAVVKSSGIGLSIAQDQKLALSAIKKELNKVFK
jgi:hypothetical protein